MHDCKALQSGTSHNFGNGFAKAFGIEYTNKENKLSPVYETSWGMSTRIIGAIIMVHGDDSGLVLPPRIAPVQTMIIPIQQKKDGVLDKAFEIRDTLKSNFSVKVDDSDKSPGWKFSEQEIQEFLPVSKSDQRISKKVRQLSFVVTQEKRLSHLLIRFQKH